MVAKPSNTDSTNLIFIWHMASFAKICFCGLKEEVSAWAGKQVAAVGRPGLLPSDKHTPYNNVTSCHCAWTWKCNNVSRTQKDKEAQKLHTFNFNQEKQPWDFLWKRFSMWSCKACRLSIVHWNFQRHIFHLISQFYHSSLIAQP